MGNEQVITTVQIVREPGHLYFIDKDGDLAKRKANRGHTPSGPLGENHPIRKVKKLGIRKKPGHLYYIDKAGTIKAKPMRQFVKP